MRNLNRANNEAEQHNALTYEQRQAILQDLTILLRDNVQHGLITQLDAKKIAETTLEENGLKEWQRDHPNSSVRNKDLKSQYIGPYCTTCVHYW